MAYSAKRSAGPASTTDTRHRPSGAIAGEATNSHSAQMASAASVINTIGCEPQRSVRTSDSTS